MYVLFVRVSFAAGCKEPVALYFHRTKVGRLRVCELVFDDDGCMYGWQLTWQAFSAVGWPGLKDLEGPLQSVPFHNSTHSPVKTLPHLEVTPTARKAMMATILADCIMVGFCVV